MAQNKVEYHIQQGGFFTFKVKEGETIKIGQLVELKGDRKVGLASKDSQKAIGVVYSGTVGIDGTNVGYSGDNNEVVTVVILKPFVFLTAGSSVVAGDYIKAGDNGNAVPHTDSGAYLAGEFKQVIGMAITGATAGENFIAVIG